MVVVFETCFSRKELKRSQDIRVTLNVGGARHSGGTMCKNRGFVTLKFCLFACAKQPESQILTSECSKYIHQAV